MVAVRIEHSAVEHLRGDRRAAGRTQEARRRAGGQRHPLGRPGIRDVPARNEVAIPRTPIRFGHERYSALGIAREDWEARQRAAIANWDCFGAPAALFCYIDRDLGVAQWADLGMYLQTVMLLLRAEGLHSCPQMAWSQVRKTVEDIVSPPDALILFCGMSIGYEDVTAEYIRTGRAPLDETVTFIQD